MNFRAIFFLFAVLFGVAATAHAQSVIRAGQAVQIDIRGVPPEDVARISGNYPVSDGGTVNLPMIGTISAAGLTPTALGSRIESAYKSAQIYRTPTIMVIAGTGDAIRKQIVTVGGRVRRTGPVEFVPGLTIFQAVQSAGGADEFGALNRVLLTRNGTIRKLDLKQEQFKGFVLQENDTIEVPEKNWRGQ